MWKSFKNSLTTSALHEKKKILYMEAQSTVMQV